MHYVVKSGRSAAMRGMLMRKTVRANTVVAPHAQPSGISNDLAFFLPCFTRCCRFGGAPVLLVAGDQDPPCLGVAWSNPECVALSGLVPGSSWVAWRRSPVSHVLTRKFPIQCRGRHNIRSRGFTHLNSRMCGSGSCTS
jgi:hypothetical protein